MKLQYGLSAHEFGEIDEYHLRVRLQISSLDYPRRERSFISMIHHLKV